MMMRQKPRMLRQPAEPAMKTAARSIPRAIRQAMPTRVRAAWSARRVQPLAAAQQARGTTWAPPARTTPERAVAALVRLEAKPPSAAAVVAAPRRVVALKRVAAAWQAAADSRVAAALRAAAGSRVAVLKRVVADSRVAVAARADGPERLVATAAVRAKAAAPEKRAAAKPGARVLGAVADEAGAADLSPCSDAISAGRGAPSSRTRRCDRAHAVVELCSGLVHDARAVAQA
jgi:hypothetical protein